MTAKEESAEREVLKLVAAHIYNNEETVIRPLPGAGSSRRYYRLSNPAEPGRTLIAAAGDNVRENFAFVGLARLMRREGINVPEVVACFDPEGRHLDWGARAMDPAALKYSDIRYYVQEDLGDLSLLEYLKGCGDEERDRMMELVWDQLTRAQDIPREKWEDVVMHPSFDKKAVVGDLHYFKYCFLKVCGIEFDEQKLEDEFEFLAQLAGQWATEKLMLRDFQSRNIMVRPGRDGEMEPWLIDFQGARPGLGLYDAVSFLWQSRLGFDRSQRFHYVQTYMNKSLSTIPLVMLAHMSVMMDQMPGVVAVRTMQTLGAYGLRGLIERKPQFLSSIETGVKTLRQVLENPSLAGSYGDWYQRQLKDGPRSAELLLPELMRIVGKLEAMDWTGLKGMGSTDVESPSTETAMNGKEESVLTVTVSSFSYKKGYPMDMSGNGGGFVFDCRALPNPGRYERYKLQTGMDDDVVGFLETKPEVAEFQEHVRALVGQAFGNYIERGFTSLSVSFGCTGGRHRSVYNCERLAEWLKKEYPQARVLVRHTEQKISREL